MVLTVYDWDRFSKDDVVGCVRIKVALIHTHTHTHIHTHTHTHKHTCIMYRTT